MYAVCMPHLSGQKRAPAALKLGTDGLSCQVGPANCTRVPLQEQVPLSTVFPAAHSLLSFEYICVTHSLLRLAVSLPCLYLGNEGICLKDLVLG